jgi:leader peptidase (prepilin peptidase)/N-methyltransferase
VDISLLPLLVVALFGLSFGSFATVLTMRVPRNISIITPSSRCENCAVPIPRRNLIPILSYLLLRGKTSCCNSTISWQYPLIELATATLFIVSYNVTGASLKLLPVLVLAILTMPLALTDIAAHRLPNSLTYAGFLAGIFASIIISIGEQSVAPFRNSLLLAFISSLCFLGLNLVSRGGMGMGDVKLAAMLGALLGPFGSSSVLAGFIFAFFLGAIIGLILLVFKKATRKTLIPFGPYMLLGSWLALGIGVETCKEIINVWSLKG